MALIPDTSAFSALLDGDLNLGRALVGEAELAVPVAALGEYLFGIRAELKSAGKPIATNDLWIATAARQHKVPLSTRDSHFNGVRGLEVRAW